MQERQSEFKGPEQVIHGLVQVTHLFVELSLKVPEGQSETHVELDWFRKRFAVQERHEEAEASEQVKQLGLQLWHERGELVDPYWPG